MDALYELILESKCPICLDFYTLPRKAPCQHNFCQECIYQHIKSKNSSCPTCRYRGVNKRSLSPNSSLEKIAGIVRVLSNALGDSKHGSDGEILLLQSIAGSEKSYEFLTGQKDSKKRRTAQPDRRMNQTFANMDNISGPTERCVEIIVLVILTDACSTILHLKTKSTIELLTSSVEDGS